MEHVQCMITSKKLQLHCTLDCIQRVLCLASGLIGGHTTELTLLQTDYLQLVTITRKEVISRIISMSDLEVSMTSADVTTTNTSLDSDGTHRGGHIAARLGRVGAPPPVHEIGSSRDSTPNSAYRPAGRPPRRSTPLASPRGSIGGRIPIQDAPVARRLDLAVAEPIPSCSASPITTVGGDNSVAQQLWSEIGEAMHRAK